MAKNNNYFAYGFQSTLGSLGAFAVLGLVAALGIYLVMSSKDPVTGERQTAKFAIGAVLVVVAALPALPYFGLGLLFDDLTNQS